MSHFKRTIFASLLNESNKALDKIGCVWLHFVGGGCVEATGDLLSSMAMFSGIAKLEYTTAGDTVIPRGFDTVGLGTIDGVDSIDGVKANLIGADYNYGTKLFVESFDTLCSTSSHVYEK